MTLILAGDIGGTKTHLALFKNQVCVQEEKYQSKNFSSLLDIVKVFLKERRVEKACFAIAGPVEEGRCVTTNLAWHVEEKKLASTLQIQRLKLINDLESTARGLLHLKEEEFFTLQVGKRQSANCAVIAAGTGLGEAVLYWDGKQYHPFACEGGHVDFAPRDEKEQKLLSYLMQKYGHVSYERVISGMGLENLYDFLGGKKEEGDVARMISQKGIQDRGSLCGELLSWFCSLYGREAGNLALKSMALGGVYVGGGIAPKILDVLKEGNFIKAFCDKGRFSHLLSTISVKVILNENTALLGAAKLAEVL